MKWTFISIISLCLLLFSWATYDLCQLEVIPWDELIYNFLTGVLFGLLMVALVKMIISKFEFLEDYIYSGHLMILARITEERISGGNAASPVAQPRIQRPWNRDDQNA